MRILLIALFAVCCASAARGEEIAPRGKGTIDREYVLYATGLWAATIADVETTRHALGKGGVREGNPLFGDDPSRGRMYAIIVPLNLLSMYAAYRGKQSGRWWWRLPVLIPTGTHGVAAGLNLRF